MKVTNYVRDVLGMNPEDVKRIEHVFFDCFR